MLFAAPPPQAKKHKKITNYHGFIKEDDYAWLRVDNWQEVLKDPSKLESEVKNYLIAENKYLESFLEDSQNLQQTLFEEMKARIKEDDSSVPEKDGKFYYGISYNKGGQYPNYFRSTSFAGEKEIYLCGDEKGKGKDYFQIGGAFHCPKHQKFVWSFDDKGAEFYKLQVCSFDNMAKYNDAIENTGGYAVWDAEGEGFFYTKLDDNHRASEVYYHKLGQEKDHLVYKESDTGFFVQVRGSRLKDFIYIDIHDHQTSEIWILKANDPYGKATCVKPRETGVEYNLTEGGDVFYILTNAGQAKDFKIMQTPIDKIEPENWKELIPHEEGKLILNVEAYKNYIAWLERLNGLPRLMIMERDTKIVKEISFKEEAYSLGFIGACEYDTDHIRFTYSSLTTPHETFSYSMRDSSRQLLKKQEIPSGHNSEDYITKRLMAKAEDGEEIPISLYYHKDTPINGNAPCILYGYGAYGISIPASFSSTTISLVNRGFIYAIAHIRGGKEKGARWYENGKYKNKKNSFTDFICAGRYLVQQNYTAHDRLIAYGGSAGGMLMGAVANMAPKDFQTILAIVPFVDVLNTMLDDSLPLTPPEWPEWGNPLKSKSDYSLIASYSPYDNIEAQEYPNILAMAGLTDPRVTYWEAAKWIAKLRAYKTSKNPVFLRTNMDSGHAGAAGRFTKLKETALLYSYIIKINTDYIKRT